MLIPAGCQIICAKGPSTSSEKEKDTKDERTPITSYCKSDLDKFQKFLDLKGEMLSQTTFQTLMRKRNELALKLREIEDEIAMNDKLIKWFTALSELDMHDKQPVSPSIERKSLFEAVLDTNAIQSSCQKLEDICRANNWTPPTYNLTQRDGGFLADLAVKVPEYEVLGAGVLSSSPDEAKESAAAAMLTNLRNAAKNLKQTSSGPNRDMPSTSAEPASQAQAPAKEPRPKRDTRRPSNWNDFIHL